MSPRSDDQGNYDDTEFPPNSENADEARRRPEGRETDSDKRVTDDEGDYEDKDQ